MTQPKKQQVGTVPCPFPKCDCTCKVFRFEERSGRNSMFKGKLYAQCDTFGRFGADGRQASQDYILENGTIWGARKPEGEAEAEPEKPREKPASVPAPVATNQPAKSAPKPAGKPAAQPAAKPAQEQPKPKGSGWGFFQ